MIKKLLITIGLIVVVIGGGVFVSGNRTYLTVLNEWAFSDNNNVQNYLYLLMVLCSIVWFFFEKIVKYLDIEEDKKAQEILFKSTIAFFVITSFSCFSVSFR